MRQVVPFLTAEWSLFQLPRATKKHGVAFEEAQTVFFDESAMEFFDTDHSQEEDRFLLLGQSFSLRTLMVCHCLREKEDVIRIISARKASARERRTYQRNKQ